MHTSCMNACSACGRRSCMQAHEDPCVTHAWKARASNASRFRTGEIACPKPTCMSRDFRRFPVESAKSSSSPCDERDVGTSRASSAELLGPIDCLKRCISVLQIFSLRTIVCLGSNFNKTLTTDDNCDDLPLNLLVFL